MGLLFSFLCLWVKFGNPCDDKIHGTGESEEIQRQDVNALIIILNGSGAEGRVQILRK